MAIKPIELIETFNMNTLLKFTSYITKRGNVKRGLLVNDSFKKFNLLHSRGVLEMQTKIIFISTSN